MFHVPSHYQRICIQDLIEHVGKSRNTNWGRTITQRWPATEAAAAAAVLDFQAQYDHLLTVPDKDNNNNNNHAQGKKQKRPNHLASFLSPYLARGLVSPRQVYRALHQRSSQQQQREKGEPAFQQSGSNSFLRRLAWKDYAYVVSLAFPGAVHNDNRYKIPIRSGYESAQEGGDDNNNSSSSSRATTQCLLQRWKDGLTGFPLVDAGMRQLIQEGFMPQQVRLAVSACLVEGLNVPWKYGIEHFETYLVDFDHVINTQMWMNAGGIGLDPYYIGLDYKKRPYWDARGMYIRTWCPELQSLPD